MTMYIKHVTQIQIPKDVNNKRDPKPPQPITAGVRSSWENKISRDMNHLHHLHIWLEREANLLWYQLHKMQE